MRSVLLFYLTFICALAVFISPDTARAKKDTSRYEEVCDFGALSGDSDARRVLSINNKSNAPLSIDQVRASCDCVQILSFPETISPRKKGRLEIRLLPYEAGPFACDITLETGAPAGSRLLFKLKGEIKGNIRTTGIDPAQRAVLNALVTQKIRKRNAALMVSVEDVLSKLGKKERYLLIDVRDETEYARFRIPGSVHVPLYAIKTKEFLLNQRIVLVCEGPGYHELELECERLRKAGFMASILDGGLSKWKQRNGPTEGDASAWNGLNTISPRTWFEERHNSSWIALSACQSRKEETSLFIPQAIPIAGFQNDSPRFISDYKAALGKKINDTSIVVVILNDDGKHYESMEKLLHTAGIRNVYFLSGGLDGYKAYAEQQASLIRAENLPKRIENRCPTCQ